jgi:predicted TIM-barrel fold metal-dependent hydrolase
MEAGSREASGPPVTDTHVHIFRRGEGLAEDRRYAPGYDALPGVLAGLMQSAGVARAMLVQPSFLGTDNRFLLDAIAAAPALFGGIAVVDPAISKAGLAALAEAGVSGVRLNAIGKPAPDFTGPHAGMVRHLADQGLVLQLQAEGGQWGAMEAFLSAPPCPVVIDHFGRTPPGDASGGFESLLRAASRSERLWFKFSAPYRMAEGIAAICAETILRTVGPERIIWGSDWPHTQFEGRNSYADTLAWLAEWVPDAGARNAILAGNLARLFRWS